jgi:hypothetical protein
MVNTKAPLRLALTATLKSSMPSFLRASHANVKVVRIAATVKNNTKKLIDLFHSLPYSFPVSNTTKKTSIIVRDKQGKLVNAYYPNNIGRTFAELYTLAKQEANKIGGYVTL